MRIRPRIEGSRHPDQWILRGNHHDAWVNGATDPVSGMAATLAEAKAIGGLVKNGWRPKRTLVYAAWDAEEPGLLGSTEWVEKHATELREKAVVYINSDGNGRGFLSVGGSHTLEQLVNEVAREVSDPQTGRSVLERARANLTLNGEPEVQERVKNGGDIPIYAPGFYTGYGVKTLPGIREAIEEREWKEAEEQIIITAGVLESLATAISRSTELIEAKPLD